MPSPYIPIGTIKYAPPPPYRTVPGVSYGSGTVAMKSMTMSCAWGLQPGTAVCTFVGDNVPVQAGCIMELECGGHRFWGVVQSDMPELGVDGYQHTLQFSDTRVFLDWDVVYGSFNEPEIKDELVSGQLKRVRQWKHVYPEDWLANVVTLTDATLTASQIIAALLGSPEVETPWSIYHCHPSTGNKTSGYHPSLAAYPSYSIDCSNGKKLGAAIQEVIEQHGILLSVFGGQFDLVFARKGEGTIPSFPATSNNRRLGAQVSNVPSRVRVVGDRNLYQVHGIKLVPDWKPAWNSYFGEPIKLRDYIYQNLTTPAAIGAIPAGTRYNNVPGDVEEALGKQLAFARALEMTVAEFADLRDISDSDGDAYRDHRKFGGKSRMNMPAALYCQNVLFRAFKLPDGVTPSGDGSTPDAFSFENIYEEVVDASGVEIVGEMFASVTHNPVTGEFFYDLNKPADGPGYAVIQGYMVGVDGFRSIRPEQFDLSKWIDQQYVWQATPFQIDDSGDYQNILFDQPVIRSSDLFTKGDGGTESEEFNGYAGLKADPTITSPPVWATLCLRAERFALFHGNGTRDEVVNLSQLREEVLLKAGHFKKNLYADGQDAEEKAAEIAATYLTRAYYYSLGGYTKSLNRSGASYPAGTVPSGIKDRVTVNYDASGLMETVDFTCERDPQHFTHARSFDRQQIDRALFPGQQELSERANQLKLVTTALRADRDALLSMAQALHGDTVEVPVTPGTVQFGTPLWKTPNTVTGQPTVDSSNTGSVASRSPITAEHTVFAGASVYHGSTWAVARVRNEGVILVRVKGPVKAGETVGRPSSDSADYLEKNKEDVVGTALQGIKSTDTRVIQVRVGGGGGGGGGDARWS